MLQPYPYPPRHHRPIAQAPYARPPLMHDSRPAARSPSPPPPFTRPARSHLTPSVPRTGYKCHRCGSGNHFVRNCPEWSPSERRDKQREWADKYAGYAPFTDLTAGAESRRAAGARPEERSRSDEPERVQRRGRYESYAPYRTEHDRDRADREVRPTPQNYDRPGLSSSSSRPRVVHERPAHGGLPPQGPSHPAGTSERDRGQPREVESSRPSSQKRMMDHWERGERQGRKRNHREAGFDEVPSEGRSRRMRSDEMPRDDRGRRPALLRNKVKGHRTGPASQKGRWPNGGMNCSRTPPPSHDILSRIESGDELVQGDGPPDLTFRLDPSRRGSVSKTGASRGDRSTIQSLQKSRQGWPAPATASYRPSGTEPAPKRYDSDKGVEIVYFSGKRTFFAHDDDDPRASLHLDRSPPIVHQDDSAADPTYASWPEHDGVELGSEMDDVDECEGRSLSRSASPASNRSESDRSDDQANDGSDDWDQLSITQSDRAPSPTPPDALAVADDDGRTGNADSALDDNDEAAGLVTRPGTPVDSHSNLDRSPSPTGIELDRGPLAPLAITSDVPFSPTVMSILPNDIPTRRLMLYHNLSSARKERPRPLESCSSSDALASGASTPRVKREPSSDGGVGSGFRLTKPDEKGQLLLLRVGPDGAEIVERFNNHGFIVVSPASSGAVAPAVAAPAHQNICPLPSPAQPARPVSATTSSPSPSRSGPIDGWPTDGRRLVKALPSQGSAFIARSRISEGALVPSAVRPDASDGALPSCVPDDVTTSPSPQPSRSVESPEQLTQLRARVMESRDRRRSIPSTSTVATGPVESRAVSTLGLVLPPPSRLSESNMLGLSIDDFSPLSSSFDKNKSASPATEAPVATPSDAEPPVLPANVQATILGLLPRDEQQSLETVCATWNRGVVAATAVGASCPLANDTALGLNIGANSGPDSVPKLSVKTAQLGQASEHVVADESEDAAGAVVLVFGATFSGPQRTFKTTPSSDVAVVNDGTLELVGLWAGNMPSAEEMKR